MGVQIGAIKTRNRVFLAPMSGVTDKPFRAIAHAHGAGLVVTEMVASEELVHARPDMVRRATADEELRPFVVQLAGREAHWMAEGARVAQDLGADIIDINMGCPARQVTGGLSGSALMRDLDHAVSLIAATVQAASVPVTVKMRLGWDHDSLNAPELARRAQDAGVAMVTVHGRTRCQFYKGKADWSAIARVKEAINIPLIANGDGLTAQDATEMMAKSGADGVMIGRGAYGRPWWPGVLANVIEPGCGIDEPDLTQEAEIVHRHHQAILDHYGPRHGNRIARKHIGWVISRIEERGLILGAEPAQWRERLLRSENNDDVSQGLHDLYETSVQRRAA
ncbi:MAG: tRNA dihydrouridine synthase DusB [Alphaproteobacteria bacterium]|nr:tRNA dihydrouridine synthase DusB [Alphaproteobacteria bacterium]